MGRPLNSKYFGEPSSPGSQIFLTEAFIPGTSASVSDAYIVAQKGTGKYIVSNGVDTGLVKLVDDSSALSEGEAKIEVTSFSGAVEHAKVIHSHVIKTFEGNVYSWNVFGAGKEGQADLPIA